MYRQESIDKHLNGGTMQISVSSSPTNCTIDSPRLRATRTGHGKRGDEEAERIRGYGREQEAYLHEIASECTIGVD